jgi:hypothetical protein
LTSSDIDEGLGCNFDAVGKDFLGFFFVWIATNGAVLAVGGELLLLERGYCLCGLVVHKRSI